MGRAVIVSVGDELLAGRITDTNATWLGRSLREAGFRVVRRETAGDEVAAIADAIGRAAAAADVVIVSGGLGPTADDVTRDGLASALGVDLALDPAAEALIAAFFARIGRPLNDANRSQAWLPKGTVPLENPCGTAPGVHARRGRAEIFVLPGVPAELKAIFETGVAPRLREHPARSAAPCVRRVTVAGMPESEVGALLVDLMARGRDPSVGSYPGLSEIELVIEAFGEDAASRAEGDVREIVRRLGNRIVSTEGTRLAPAVAQLLLDRHASIAVAESLTGGLLADALVGVPGVSAVFRAGLVCYGNEEKHALLGVPTETFTTVGAVSERCAREMAEGARARVGTAIAVATTGIAGPGGGTTAKPVGTTFVAVADARGTVVEHRVLPGVREQVRGRATVMGLDLLRRRLLDLG